MKRTKLLALLGAAVLTVGTVGVAFANTLSEDHPNQVGVSLDDLISEEGVDEDCTDFDELGILPGEGEIGIHFILPQPDAASGNISGSIDGTAFGPIANTVHGNSNALHFYVVVSGDGDSVVDEATTDVNGDGKLTISHICFGETVTTTTTTTTTDETTTTTTTDETTTTTTTTTSFTGGEQELTEPPTDTFGSNRVSNPADSAWLLVVALGVLLASLVVLSPARSRK